jgi:hypothetical protein
MKKELSTMNELTKTNIRVRTGGLTNYFKTIGELKDWCYDHRNDFSRFIAEVFEVKNNDWKQIAI